MKRSGTFGYATDRTAATSVTAPHSVTSAARRERANRSASAKQR